MREPKQATLAVRSKYADSFVRVYATDSSSFIGDFDYRILFALTSAIAPEGSGDPTAQAEYKVEIILSYTALRQLKNRLEADAKIVETRFGQVTVPTSPDDRLMT
ncbi:MAG TPA: hypothetical protein VJZ32_03165 [Candidatus Bathyarchaeia archaeon]|nr:hypothetical protein [Candidatus Bathyarchaeia archaeon]